MARQDDRVAHLFVLGVGEYLRSCATGGAHKEYNLVLGGVYECARFNHVTLSSWEPEFGGGAEEGGQKCEGATGKNVTLGLVWLGARRCMCLESVGLTLHDQG